jgi:phosphotriesterase-related protein
MDPTVELLVTRRAALQALSTTLGAAFAARATDGWAAAPAPQAGAPRPAAIPRNAIIRTVLQDLRPETLRTILFHEHLSIDVPPPQPRPADAPPPVTDNVDMILSLVKKAGSEGISCIVDGGHADMRRSMDALRRIAKESGVHIVASGGLYMDRTYPPDVATKSDDQLAEDLTREANANRYGAFGEIGQNPDLAEMTANERKVFRAVGKTHVKTNIFIFTHNAYGTGPNVSREAGLRQLVVLESVGVPLNKVVIGHSCCLDDPKADVFKQIAKRGAFVGFDRVTTVQRIMPDDKKVTMVLAFIEAGFADNLLLSADFTGQRTMEEGPG